MSGTILLVEDNTDDQSLVRGALVHGKIQNPLHVVSSGEAAIEYLSGDGEDPARRPDPLPIFVLLDLVLPGKSGFAVLEWIKRIPELKAIPVIVLSGISDLTQVSRAYQLGAITFFLKPLRAEDLSARFSRLKGFRFRISSCGARYIDVNDANG